LRRARSKRPFSRASRSLEHLKEPGRGSSYEEGVLQGALVTLDPKSQD
jgi:hypothetical protein